MLKSVPIEGTAARILPGPTPGGIPDDQKRHRHNRGARGGRPPKFDAQDYKGRNIVERGFCHLKQWRGIATRYDKLATTFRAAALLHGVIAWIKHLSDTP